jgi:nicotinate-nucleotide adenylyltransferase
MGIGVFGGTFDPVHVGHLRIAEEVREERGLDRVYFVPARIQPLKERPASPAGDRVRMLESAVRGNPGFRVSTVETRRAGVSYSIDTVRHFRRRFGEVSFLVGMDAFMDIGLWRAYEELLSSTDFVVMLRPGHAPAGLPESLKTCARQIDGSIWEHASGRRIYFHRITQLDISSTGIRELAKTGRSIKYLGPRAVERYIIRKGLYRS